MTVHSLVLHSPREKKKKKRSVGLLNRTTVDAPKLGTPTRLMDVGTGVPSVVLANSLPVKVEYVPQPLYEYFN